MPRTGPKSRVSRRRYALNRRVPNRRRTAPVRGVAGLRGSRPAVPRPSTSHRIVRPGATIDVVSNPSTGLQLVESVLDSGGVTNPLSLSTPAASFSGITKLMDFGGAMQFSLQNVYNYTDFTALFDQYQIEQIDFEVSDLHNASDNTTSVASMPTIMYTPDFDDATVPTAAATVSEYQRCKQWTFRGSGQPLKFSIKPRVATTIYNGVTPSYAPAPENLLLDLAVTTTPYYGLKFWIQDAYCDGSGTTRGETHLRIKTKYHLKFANPK